MTAKELAAMLSGREVGNEITVAEAVQAGDDGLVVVFGYSDDNMEMRGAIDAEVGAFDGTTVYLTANGLLEEPACDCAENCACPYFISAKRAAKTIEAVWYNFGSPCWTYETDIPHETFDIYEDGEIWCVGIVFSVEDLA